MKHFLILLIPLFLLACEKRECTNINFDENVELLHQDLVCIDGVEYTFEAKDERCCCGCICAWEGEFVLTFLDSNNNIVYTFREKGINGNDDPPFANNFEIISITNQNSECGDNSEINSVKFTILII